MSFVTSHGVPIYYERHGQGPAVVFCHGAGSNAATWWQQIPVFKEHFTCIAYDHRGFGRSPADPEDFLPQLFVDDLQAVLDAEGIASAALVCQSLGGISGLRFALRAADRVDAFVCCDSPLAIAHPEMLVNVKRFLQQVQATELEDRALSPGFAASQTQLAFLYTQINQFNPAVYSAAETAGWGARIAGLFNPSFLLPLSSLNELRVPTLFVVGAEDRVVTPGVVRDLAARVDGAKVVEIAGAGHSPYFEQPGTFNQAVLGFIQQQIRTSRRQDT
ncbi:alpha/beta hydrolase [Variovorax sp. LjRoot175]|uniref:alpha/beta fold hydrolase n=1 Tax=Variovorax sp. LjRoot175 TaxID=3342276 RepID=UPI003ECDFCA5